MHVYLPVKSHKLRLWLSFVAGVLANALLGPSEIFYIYANELQDIFNINKKQGKEVLFCLFIDFSRSYFVISKLSFVYIYRNIRQYHKENRHYNIERHLWYNRNEI